MTADISTLIAPYLEKDPTKFYTTEQFKESVSGEKSLVQFAVKRAASIQAQLSGELVVEANTSSNMGGPGGGGPNGRSTASQGYSMNTIMEISSFVVILLVGIVYAFFYKRRRS
ncbi:hypothetical protein [Brevibacillus choshinensis]|uniref:hypothetical protein n=1 Tax=Brevibacillus choshinensis TaxID=54911 RepID=UPI002E226EB1|nr:hypothetical protein [Brevibacillus choshinensis]